MSNVLVELRQKIDEIDHALLELVTRRLNVSREIATAKPNGSPVYRPAREALLMHQLLSQVDGTVEHKVVERLWRVLLASSVHSQKPNFKIISLHGLEDFTSEFSASFLEFTFCPTGEHIIKQLSENWADVAFFPYSQLAEIASSLGEKTGIYVNHKMDNVAIIGKNMPEETGFDISLFRDSRFVEPSIIEKPGFSLNLDSSEHVHIGAWVNLSGSLK
jgi:chorismate mutase